MKRKRIKKNSPGQIGVVKAKQSQMDRRSLIREDRGPEMKVKTENKGSEMKWLK